MAPAMARRDGMPRLELIFLHSASADGCNAWRASPIITKRIPVSVDEAFPWNTGPTYLVRDDDGAYGQAFISLVWAMGIRDRPSFLIGKIVCKKISARFEGFPRNRKVVTRMFHPAGISRHHAPQLSSANDLPYTN